MILLLWMASLVCLFLTSCDDDKQTFEVVSLSGLVSESGPGNVLLKWDQIQSGGVAYVEIVYASDNEVGKKVLVHGVSSEKMIYGFADERMYTFMVSVYMKDGQKSSAQTIEAAPDKPAFIDLKSTIEVTNGFGGIDLKWNNLSADKFYINVEYADANGVSTFSEIDVVESGEGRQFVGITGVLSADLSVSVSDVVGNTSVSSVYPFKNLEKGKLDRTIWEVPDFSSQEAVGEGANNGQCKHMLDGNKDTFWHSKWNGATPEQQKFPHYVTVDLKRKVKISKIEMTQRVAKAMSKQVVIYGSNESYSGGWTEIITIEMPGVAAATLITTLDEAVEYRWVKMFLETAGVGDRTYGGMAEFALYGEDIVEEN